MKNSHPNKPQLIICDLCIFALYLRSFWFPMTSLVTVVSHQLFELSLLKMLALVVSCSTAFSCVGSALSSLGPVLYTYYLSPVYIYPSPLNIQFRSNSTVALICLNASASSTLPVRLSTIALRLSPYIFLCHSSPPCRGLCAHRATSSAFAPHKWRET